MEKDKRDLMSEQEAADHLRTTRQNLFRQRKLGRIPHVRLNGRVLYKRSDIELLIERNYVPAMAAVAAA